MRFALTFAVNNAETKVNLDIVQISSATENLEPLMTFFFWFVLDSNFSQKYFLAIRKRQLRKLVIYAFDFLIELSVHDRTSSFDCVLYEVLFGKFHFNHN